MPLKAVFLDVDGVLSDPKLLGAEYARLMGRVLAPALGGTPADWGRANAVTFPVVFERTARQIQPEDDPLRVFRHEGVENIRAMCLELGRPIPTEDECERLGREMNVYVRGHSRAVFPGAVEAMRELAAEYALHLATGNASWQMEALLLQMGVRELVGLPAGPDLVGVLKQHPEFYRLLFALTGVDGHEAVVVDDSAAQLVKASQAGAAVVLVGQGGMPSVRDVPAAIRALAAS